MHVCSGGESARRRQVPVRPYVRHPGRAHELRGDAPPPRRRRHGHLGGGTVAGQHAHHGVVLGGDEVAVVYAGIVKPQHELLGERVDSVGFRRSGQ